MFVAIRLGTTLIGTRVLLGFDVLRLYEPYSFPDNHPVTSFYYVTDQLDSMIPALNEIHQRLMHGVWASWSNLVTGGTPLLSIPSLGVLTPGRWLYLLLPTALVPGWSKLIELAVASSFTYLFVRRLNGSKLAAGLAGFVYPLTGFMIGWTNYPQVAVATMIPMVFWAVERYIQQPRLRALVPVSIACAFLMFGGFPAVAGQTFYVVGGYGVLRVISANRHHFRDILVRLGWIAAAAGVGVGVTAFQLLPFTRQVLSGVSLGYRSSDFFAHTSFTAALTAFLPRSFATNALCCGYSPQDINNYIGAIVLFLVVLGILHAVWGRLQGGAGLYFAGVIAAVIVLIWFQGWWTSWMNNLPIWHANPIGRVRSQLGLPVAVLAAGGLDFLRLHRWSPSWWRRELPESKVIVAAVAVGTGALVAGSGLALALRAHPWVPTRTIERDTIVAGLPLLVIACLALASRRAGSRTLLLVVIVVGVVAQAFVATSYYWPTVKRSDFYPTDTAIQYVQQHQGDDRIATTGYTLRANVTEFYGLRAFNGHAFLDPAVEDLTLAIDPSSLLGATYTAFSTNIASVIRSPGLDRMGVHYLVAGVDDMMPGTADTPVPIPGIADAVAQPAGTTALRAGVPYHASVPSGALRGVNVALTATQSAIVTVTVRSADGSVLATDSRRVLAGTGVLPVPLAADPGTPTPIDPTQPLDVAVSVDTPGVTASTGAGGRIWIQAVRPTPSGDMIRLAYAGDGLVVWERLNYVPRIHFASRATVIPDANARLQAVANSPAKADNVILAAPGPELGSPASTSARLVVTKDDGDDTQVRLTTATPGYVVVADTIQRNFTATVDGHREPIVDADYAAGAVFVPAGTHDVHVAYNPSGRSAGAALSAASIATLLVVGLVPTESVRRIRRRRARELPSGG
ncbi:MAG: hypothetical protein M3N95_14500 [Actinomycetota bacterium]|nr:hypothetical protein [Actinomycetota bacterium]